MYSILKIERYPNLISKLSASDNIVSIARFHSSFCMSWCHTKWQCSWRCVYFYLVTRRYRSGVLTFLLLSWTDSVRSNSLRSRCSVPSAALRPKEKNGPGYIREVACSILTWYWAISGDGAYVDTGRQWLHRSSNKTRPDATAVETSGRRSTEKHRQQLREPIQGGSRASD